MSAFGGPNIIEDGLVLYLDAGNRKSYPGSGTTWFDISGYKSTGILTNGPTFNSSSLGSLVFDGINNYVNFGGSQASLVRSATSLSIGATFFCTGFSNIQSGYGWAPLSVIDRYSLGNDRRKFTFQADIENGVEKISAFFF